MSTIAELFADLNGGLVYLKTEHTALAANALISGTSVPSAHLLGETGANFALLTPEGWACFKTLDTAPPITLYGQRDPTWRDLVYAGGMTFGQAGCYVTAVTMMLSLAGYEDDPPTVAAKLREANCFNGALLGRPDRIPDAYPLMRYDGPVDVSRDGPLRWHDGAADMERFKAELEKGSCIIEVDFIPPTAKFNQHFVVAERLTPDGKDLLIADPWDGTRTKLLERYAQTHWDLKRAIYGMRLLRVRD